MAELLKNIYTETYISYLANKIQENYHAFQTTNFQNAVFDTQWQNRELKERMRHIALMLHEFLPIAYEEQLEVLKKVSTDIYSYEGMFLQDFVEVFGLEDYENSIKALEVFTVESSSEFAIRQFIIKYEDRTMQQLKVWAKSENEHIRRLASEGCRPRLPWAIALPKYKKDPSRVLEILELLKNDSSEYVRKSVANNLNDIAKDNPEIVIAFVQKNLGTSKELDWICKHASRTLLKAGNQKVLKLFGYVNTSHINITCFEYDKEVAIGDTFSFSCVLESPKPLGNLRLEYMIYYKKANGSHSKKVFMISQGEIKSLDKAIKKSQSFKELTTRKHYEGEHFIALVLNGEEKLKKSFTVKK